MSSIPLLSGSYCFTKTPRAICSTSKNSTFGEEVANSYSFDSNHIFIVGTSSPVETNEIHVVEFQENSDNSIHHHNTSIISHEGEIIYLDALKFHENKINSNTIDLEILVASKLRKYFSINDESCSLVRYHHDRDTNKQNIQMKVDFTSPNPFINTKKIIKNVDNKDKFVIVDGKGFEEFDILKPNNESSFITRSEEYKFCHNGAIDPHHSNLIGVAEKNYFYGWDFRTTGMVFKKVNLNKSDIFNIDFNPNLSYCLMTAEENGDVKFYDIRNLTEAIHVLANAHNHCVRYSSFNPFHDQLVITAGGDGLIKLWNLNLWKGIEENISSLSVKIFDSNDRRDIEHRIDFNAKMSGINNDLGHKIVKIYGRPERIISGIQWSKSDAWNFGSISYDNNTLSLYTVPNDEKYEILLR